MKEVQEAEPEVGLEISEKNVTLVIPLSVGFEQVAQFKENLQKVENLTIVMTGGSEDEGSKIIVSVQKPMNLVHMLNEMPMVGDVHTKGTTIVVMLKTLNANNYKAMP